MYSKTFHLKPHTIGVLIDFNSQVWCWRNYYFRWFGNFGHLPKYYLPIFGVNQNFLPTQFCIIRYFMLLLMPYLVINYVSWWMLYQHYLESDISILRNYRPVARTFCWGFFWKEMWTFLLQPTSPGAVKELSYMVCAYSPHSWGLVNTHMI